jgi:phytoene dehydrogenase-like protein
LVGTWRHGGLAFDTGAHTLTLPAVYRDLFIKTGSRKKSKAAALEDNVDLRPLDPVRRYVFPDGTRLDLPNASLGRMRATFDEALGIGAGEAWIRVIRHGSLVWDTIRPALVDAPGSGRPELTRLLRTRGGRRALTPRRSLRDLAARWFGDPRLSLLLDDYARQAGADPLRAPGVLAMWPYIEHAFGAWRIAGGMHTLAEALHQRALDRGVDVRLGARAVRIETRGAGRTDAPSPTRRARPAVGSGAVCGVLLESGERLAADIVVAAVDRAALAQLLGAREPKGPYMPPVTTLCLEVDQAPAMLHETVLLDELAPALRIHVAAERPSAWTVHAQGGGTDAQSVLAALARRGFDVRRTARVLHVIPPEFRQAVAGTPGGTGYGPAANSLRAALLRSPVAQPITGLYHVGASARPGPGLPFAALSGWHASELIKAAGPVGDARGHGRPASPH